MGTYTAKVDKYGKAEVYFNNIKVFMNNLNSKDIFNESEHEFYAQIKYKNVLNKFEDTTQLKVKNTLEKLISPPKHNKVAVVDIPDKKKKPEIKTGVKITVNVFFDGTKNNATNTEARLLYLKQKKGIQLTDKETEKADAYKRNKEAESSYENFFSNVAIMHQLNSVNKTNREIKVYIEGEGTENLLNDDNMGYAFGGGITGIRSKVTKAFKKIKEDIDSLRKDNIIKENEFVNEIHLNVFGFSRGAAAARHFVSRRHELQNIFTHVESNNFHIMFVGLFDTVSSYEEEGEHGSPGAALSHDFDNDVEELKLKLEGNVAKVVHLTAADEYRKFFSLTNIKSSIEAGIGYELQLPGAHSDIGGGYGETENEVRDLNLEQEYDNIKESVIKEGWYLPYQIVRPQQSNTTIRATRNGIPNSYQYIPLAIMIQLAEKYGLKFNKSLTYTEGLDYSVPDDLLEAKESLLKYALENDAAKSEKITIRSEYLHPIRNKYLHRSAYIAIGKVGRYKDGKPYRKHHDG
ncbi:phospholipase effector Tle1 domain-containing protein [Flavobacterium procerum]